MATYEIGKAGSEYQNLSDIEWNSLQPGDVVQVYWREEAYNERLLLKVQGTEDNPIIIEGIPGPNGEMPVLDANNATTPEQFDGFNAVWRQNLGGSIYVGPENSYPDEDEIPQHIVIRGFEITGSGQGNSFTDANGVEHEYAGQAGIYVKGGDNITIEDNYFHHNGLGIFSNSNHAYEITENLVISGNTFEENGVVGNYLYHHVYTEGVNTVVDGNVFGNKIDGDLGSLLKMRDVGVTISNNEFGSSPGHIIDLGDVQSDAMRDLAYGQTDEFYHDNYVYGNTINASTGNIYLGGDSYGKESGDGAGTGTYRQTLEFTDNTVIYNSDQSDQWRLGILRAPSSEQTFNVSGNVFEASSLTEGQTPTNFALLASDGNLNLTGENSVSAVISLWADNAAQGGVVTGWETVTVTGGSTPDPVDPDPVDPDPVDPDPVDPDPVDPNVSTAGDDLLFGTAGNDAIDAMGGDDTVYGEEGDDYVNGADGNDLLNGDSGNDTLAGYGGDDYLYGGLGNDLVYGGAGSDRLAGGEGDDNLYGHDGDDKLLGGNGDDDLSGGAGNDELSGDVGNDYMFGGTGNDVVLGGAGNDTVYADAGDDYASGGDGSDFLNGDSGNDILTGDAGNDYLYGGWGNDVVSGGSGNDRVAGGNDNDILSGNDGDDKLLGGSGDDYLSGGDGVDELSGNEGDDTIVGGAGYDNLFGGSGADTFAFETANALDAVDGIWDFNVAEGDSIDISDLLIGFDAASDDINDFVRLEQSGWKHAVLSVDADGGGDNFVSVVTIGYGKDLELGDMISSDSLVL